MKFKTLSVLVTAALLAGCGGSSSGGNPTAEKISFTTVQRTASDEGASFESGEQQSLLCKVPNFEVQVHNLDGELIKTVTSDANGDLQLSKVPANHYISFQDDFEPGYNYFTSIQKELITKEHQIDLYDYPGDVVDCVDYEDTDESSVQQIFIDTDLTNFSTMPWLDRDSGTDEYFVELEKDAPGIFALKCSDNCWDDEFSEYIFIPREEFEGERVTITEDMLKPFEKSISVDVGMASDTSLKWVVDGHQYTREIQTIENPTLNPISHNLDLPSVVTQVTAASMSIEHILLNGFVYGSQQTHNSDSFAVAEVHADSFVMGDYDGQTLTFELNGFKSDLAVALKEYGFYDEESDSSIYGEHITFTKNSTTSITPPDILPIPDVAKDDVSEVALLIELDDPKNIDIENFEDLEGKVIVPVWEGLGELPDDWSLSNLARKKK